MSAARTARARLAAARAIWQDRRPPGSTDRAYLAYTLVLLALVVGTPIGRAAWLAVTTPATAAAWVSPATVHIVDAVVLGVWAVALVVGRSRGPAVAAPFLVHAMTGSDLPRRTVFRLPVVVAVVSAGVVGCGLAAFVGAALGSLGLLTPVDVLRLAAVGVCVGVVAAACWLVGEALPRAAAVAAVILLGVAGVVATGPSAPAWIVLGLGLLAVGGIGTAPLLLDRIDDRTLTAQAAAWDVAIAHTVSLDLTAAAESYRALPTVGRRRDAVLRSGPLALVVPVRDAVGAARTPVRLAAGAVTLAAAGSALVLAAALPHGGPLVGALAAVLLASGVGAFSRGLQHAAQVARDLPLYGIGDGRLLLLHSLLPTAATVLLAGGTAVLLGALVAPTALPVVVWSGIVLPLVTVAAHVSNALRGPSPLFLLTPAPSPVGDPMPAIRVLWAMDSLLLTVLAGAVVPLGPTAAGALVAVVLVLAVVLMVRWVRRA